MAENDKNTAAAAGNGSDTASPSTASTADAPQAQEATAAQQQQLQVNYSVSGGLRARLEQLNISLLFTSSQFGLVYLIGRRPEGGISIHHTRIPGAMGVCVEDSGRGFAVAGAYQIFRFVNVLDGTERANEAFDACYVPRTTHLTGRLDVHDIGVREDNEPVFISTRHNCLATLSPRYSFSSLWQPPFISELADEDRCHLNGLAMEDGKPRYATAVSRSDVADEWRQQRQDGGVVVDVESGEVVCEGLSMPHSPRLHNGELWVLNSGTGELGIVHRKGRKKGQFESVVFCPGFGRGLAFHGNYAFVGLSKPRYKSAEEQKPGEPAADIGCGLTRFRFDGLALEERLKEADSEPWCGIQVIDLANKSCADWLRIDGQVSELYDVGVLPGSACPMAVSADSSEAAQLTKFKPMDPPPQAREEA